MTDATMTISGREAVAATTFDVIDPATGAVHGAAPECTEKQPDAAMESAAKDSSTALCPPTTLPTTETLARRMAANGPLAIRKAKEV